MDADGNAFGSRRARRMASSGRPLALDLLLLSAAGLVALSALVAGCGNDKSTQSAPAVPVLAAEAVQADVPVTVDAIGTVEPLNSVAVTPRVSGQILEVVFSEGQEVAKGTVLFRIDPAPYEASLALARANLERDRARLVDAEAELARYTDLVGKQLVAEQEYGSVAAAAGAARATVQADSAALEIARLNLDYCSVRAPIGGRTGGVLVKQGNQVTAGGASTLVTINQIAPVNVTFSVPEQKLPDVRRYYDQGPLAVRAFPGSDTAGVYDGRLAFINNAVDVETGTILLKAVFPNEDRALWPGQFVRVQLVLLTQAGAVVVPAPAVETSQQGRFVYVIKPDDTVEMRPVASGTTLDGRTVIESGLQSGERVVTDGQLRLRPGARVTVKSGLDPAAGAQAGTPGK